MGNGRNALVLANATAIARNGNAARWGKYEVLVGEPEHFREVVWITRFPARGKNGVSIVIADNEFIVHTGFADFRIRTGQAFVTTQDVDVIDRVGIALKISLDKDAVRLPSVPLHHVVGMDISVAGAMTARMADFSGFGIPLKIANYNLPDNPYEAFASTLAEHLGKPTGSVNREETIRLDASANPRVLFAYGQSIFLCERDLSEGLMAAIRPETEVVLNISRRPRIDGQNVYQSYGVVMVLEDLESAKLLPASP